MSVKYGATIPVAREMLLDAGVVQPTAEERARAEQAAATSRQREAERTEHLAAARQALADLDDPLARAVLDLHHENEHGECEGDDIDGYEAEHPEWPCRTVQAIAAHHGIGLPS